MHWHKAALLAAILAFPFPAAAADDMAVQVRQHVRSLNAAELTVRDKAEQGLIALGPAALPLLPAISDRMPAEVVDRLSRVRQALLKNQVEEGAKASLITLSVKQAPLAEVLKEVSRQSCNRVVDHREAFGEEPSEIRVSFECNKLPFWEALDQLLDQNNLSVYNYGAEKEIDIISRPKGHLPRANLVSYSGPFRVAPTRFEALSDLRNPRNRSLKLFMEISWEPRLRPINLVQPLAAVQVKGSEGDLKVDGADGEPEVAVGPETSTIEMQIPLELPPRKIEKVSTLKGRLNALVPGPPEEFRFSELPIAKDGGDVKRVEQRKGAVTVMVDYARKNNEVWEVQMRVKFDNPAQALESHRGWVYDNEAYLENAKGNRIDHGGYEQTRQTKDEAGVKYLFDVPGGLSGLTFVYKTPLAILELPLEYELHDLQLP